VSLPLADAFVEDLMLLPWILLPELVAAILTLLVIF
jgi:hypothetical protein